MAQTQLTPSNHLETIERRGEPRVRDIDVATRLGYENPRQIRELIRRNLKEIKTYGTASYGTTPYTSGKGAVKQTREYYLNEGQALLICALSRTEKAADVRKLLIDTYMTLRAEKAPTALPDGIIDRLLSDAKSYAVVDGWLIELYREPTLTKGAMAAVLMNFTQMPVTIPVPVDVRPGCGGRFGRGKAGGTVLGRAVAYVGREQ